MIIFIWCCAGVREHVGILCAGIWRSNKISSIALKFPELLREHVGMLRAAIWRGDAFTSIALKFWCTYVRVAAQALCRCIAIQTWRSLHTTGLSGLSIGRWHSVGSSMALQVWRCSTGSALASADAVPAACCSGGSAVSAGDLLHSGSQCLQS